MSMQTFPKLLSLQEVADLLGKDLNAVRRGASRQVATGKGLGVPVVQPNGSGGRRYVRQHELVAMLNRSAGRSRQP